LLAKIRQVSFGSVIFFDLQAGQGINTPWSRINDGFYHFLPFPHLIFHPFLSFTSEILAAFFDFFNLVELFSSTRATANIKRHRAPTDYRVYCARR